MRCDTVKSRVFPYVDGELSPDVRGEMEAHLAACGSCRRLVEQEFRFRDAYVAPLRPDPAPAHVRDGVERLLGGLSRDTGRRRLWSRPWIQVAAAIALVAIGVASGIGVQSAFQRGNLLAELTEASVDQHQKLASGLLPPDFVAASPRAVEAWFRQRLDFNINLPELKNANISLLGGRVSHLANVEVAALEYRFDDRHISLFVIPEEAYRRLGLSEKPKFKMLNHRGYDVIIWRQHGTGYALVSEIGNRSCLVCHSSEEILDAPLEPLTPHGVASPKRRIDS